MRDPMTSATNEEPHLHSAVEMGVYLLVAPKPNTIAYSQWTTMNESQEREMAQATRDYLLKLEQILTVRMVSC